MYVPELEVCTSVSPKRLQLSFFYRSTCSIHGVLTPTLVISQSTSVKANFQGVSHKSCTNKRYQSKGQPTRTHLAGTLQTHSIQERFIIAVMASMLECHTVTLCYTCVQTLSSVTAVFQIHSGLGCRLLYNDFMVILAGK